MPWQRLSALPDFQLPPDQPQLIGWPVLDRGGEPAGRVEDLFVDLSHIEVASLAVRTAGGELVTVPREFARLEDGQVLVSVDRATLEKSPPWHVWASESDFYTYWQAAGTPEDGLRVRIDKKLVPGWWGWVFAALTVGGLAYLLRLAAG